MATPNAPNPYMHGENLPTVRVHNDGSYIDGQTRLINRHHAHERYNKQAEEHGSNLMSDFDAEMKPDQVINTPSTPTRGGSQKKKHGGSQSTPPSTPVRRPRELVAPGAPLRPTIRQRREAEQYDRTPTQQPIELFPSSRRDNMETRRPSGSPAQGGTKRKRSPKSVKKSVSRRKKTNKSKRYHKKTHRAHKNKRTHYKKH